MNVKDLMLLLLSCTDLEEEIYIDVDDEKFDIEGIIKSKDGFLLQALSIFSEKAVLEEVEKCGFTVRKPKILEGGNDKRKDLEIDGLVSATNIIRDDFVKGVLKAFYDDDTCLIEFPDGSRDWFPICFVKSLEKEK